MNSLNEVWRGKAQLTGTVLYAVKAKLH